MNELSGEWKDMQNDGLLTGYQGCRCTSDRTICSGLVYIECLRTSAEKNSFRTSPIPSFSSTLQYAHWIGESFCLCCARVSHCTCICSIVKGNPKTDKVTSAQVKTVTLSVHAPASVCIPLRIAKPTCSGTHAFGAGRGRWSTRGA